jgi:hypothetical protein
VDSRQPAWGCPLSHNGASTTLCGVLGVGLLVARSVEVVAGCWRVHTPDMAFSRMVKGVEGEPTFDSLPWLSTSPDANGQPPMHVANPKWGCLAHPGVGCVAPEERQAVHDNVLDEIARRF